MHQYFVKTCSFCVITTILLLVSACKKNENPKITIQHDPKIEEVFSKILDAWNQFDSISANVLTKMNQAAGGPGKTNGNGIYHLSKNESHTRINFKIGNVLMRQQEDDPKKQMAVTEYLYFITDGETMYHAKFQFENEVVIKSKYDFSKILQLGGKKYLQNIKDTHHLNYLSETFVDGRDVYLIEAIPLEGDWTRLYYFDQQTGLQMKMVERNHDGEDVFTIELSDLNPMVEYAPEQFQYTVPDGVKFIDETKD